MKITLITGATGGLGKAFARIYSKDKNDLLLVATNEQKHLDLKTEIESEFGVSVDYFAADLSDKNQLKAVYDYAKNKGYFVAPVIIPRSMPRFYIKMFGV